MPIITTETYEVPAIIDIDPAWSEYDKSVARGQLHDCGFILLDEHDLPLDNEWDTSLIINDLKSGKAKVIEAYDGKEWKYEYDGKEWQYEY